MTPPWIRRLTVLSMGRAIAIRFVFTMKILMQAGSSITPNIFAFAERGRSAWLRCLRINQSAMLAAENRGFVVRRIEIDFLLPSGLGTVLEVESSLLRLGGASLTLQQKYYES